MTAMDTHVIHRLIDVQRYPLTEPENPLWKQAITSIKHDLDSLGCCVLPGFIRAELLEVLQQESAQLSPAAYYKPETVNAYNTDVTQPLPEGHPGRIHMERGNAFVPRDCIPDGSLIHQLYVSPVFKAFIAECFELEHIHELADPLAALCLNVLPPGREHPWHFDTNEFTVSLLTQEQQSGGLFEYCANIRSSGAENFDQVHAVLEGQGDPWIRRLWLRPGDLQLFKGRFSLHRVSPVTGERARHTAIFAYTERPGVIGSLSRTQQLFGRVLPQHLAAQTAQVRGDQLLD
jgi:hypothetical protein